MPDEKEYPKVVSIAGQFIPRNFWTNILPALQMRSDRHTIQKFLSSVQLLEIKKTASFVSYYKYQDIIHMPARNLAEMLLTLNFIFFFTLSISMDFF